MDENGSTDHDHRPTADAPRNKYSRLPEPIPREAMRTSQDVVQPDEPVGEADRERDWLLRTAGIFI